MKYKDYDSPNLIKAIGGQCLYPNCMIVKSQQQYVSNLEGTIHDLQMQLGVQEAIIEELKGQLRNKNSALFAASSEKSRYNSTTKEDEKTDGTNHTAVEQTTNSSKKRGGQVGHKGHGRKIPEGLPVVVVKHELSTEERLCLKCGKLYRETVMSEISVEVDIEIRVIKKEHQRYTYAQSCSCEEVPVLITAPKSAQIIPKSLYSNAFWAFLLVTKYFFQIPINKQIDQWQMHSLDLNPGTLAGGFQRLHRFIIPLYDELVKISRTEKHWHADETSWFIFDEIEGKASFRWWMWVFVSEKVCIYVLDESRSGKVALAHFGTSAEGILNVDRYSAYNCLDGKIQRALCWYHVRRDFVKAADSSASLEAWAKIWMDHIALLEQLNKQHMICTENEDFEERQRVLLAHLQDMKEQATLELESGDLSKRQVTILKSLLRNWLGLTIFVDHPEVPMHNNVAERALRN
jgi:transposase